MWDSLIGQDRAVAILRGAVKTPVHAYLIIGPEGCGKEEAALIFAGALISQNDDPNDRANDLARRGAHPDVHVITRQGASILKDQADEVIRVASLTPTEGTRKVIIMHEVNLMQPAAIVRLLKTLEEPSAGVYFILLSDSVDDTMATIVSRCITVKFGSLQRDDIAAALANEGVNPDIAAIAASSAHGSLARARLLASDRQLAQRREFFANIPRRIDGTGATVISIVEQIISMIDDSVEPIHQRHEQEIEELEKTLSVMGVKRGGKKALEDKHKREVRRHRTDELRDGLSEIAGVYRDELARTERILRPEAYVVAVTRIHEAMRHLALNVNEAILLRDLIWSLPSPSADAALQNVLAEVHE